MRKIYFLLVLLVSQLSISQSVCNPNGISTNPSSPVNPQDANYLNRFNWASTDANYPINSTCTPNSFTPNPFQSNQSELLPLSLIKDNKPVDGWEIIAYNLGYDNNNIALNVKPEHTYIMLYNKYTGMLRILLKWCRNTNYNGALLSLRFAPGYQSNLLDMANNEKALDTPHIANPSISTALKFYNDNNFWAYADFKLNYDPCTCAFSDSSRLALYSELISNSSVAITGKLTGTITSIANGTGTAESDGHFWKTATGVSDKMMKAHKGIEGFTKNYEDIYKNLNDAGVTIGAIKKVGDFMKNNNFMKAGLKAVPYLSEGVKFLSGLFGGGQSGETPQPLQLAPLSVNLDVKLNGTISTSDPMHNVTIGLPGSSQQNSLSGISGGQPLYNETLGIFALVNHPVMYYTENNESKTFFNREKDGAFPTKYYEIRSTYNFVSKNYKLSGESLKYVINPATGLTLQDAEIIIIPEYEKPSIPIANLYEGQLQLIGLDKDFSNGLNIDGTDKGPTIDPENAIFQNTFKPIGIQNYSNNYSFNYPFSVSATKSERIEMESIPNSTRGFRYKTCGTFGSTICPWVNIQTRPFSYDQVIPSDLSRLTSFDFVDSYFNLYNRHPKDRTPRTEFLNPQIKSFKLKLILNLKRTDVTNAQNVLYVVNYPIELKPAPAGYNMSGDNIIADAQIYASQNSFNPVIPSNKVIPATTSELQNFCSSNIYRANRSATGLGTETVENEPTKESIIVFPNPNNGNFNISLANTENETYKLEVINILGQVIQQEVITNTALLTKSINISDKGKGLFLLCLTSSKGKITKKIIVN